MTSDNVLYAAIAVRKVRVNAGPEGTSPHGPLFRTLQRHDPNPEQ
ncbi:hypothetical protein [Paenibacillus foliorum]|nr:hypothetical protein [Paenibacillus foliorum]